MQVHLQYFLKWESLTRTFASIASSILACFDNNLHLYVDDSLFEVCSDIVVRLSAILFEQLNELFEEV